MGDWGWHWLTAADKRAILDGIAEGDCHGGPFHAELQLTDRCNHSCGFCSTRRFRCGSELPIDQVVRFTRELRRMGCRSITLNGGGEPLFHREIDAALLAIADAGLHISNLTTNGTLLTPHIAELLFRASCRQIIVSLNAGDSDEYRRMMGTSRRNFARVVENVRGLVASRADAGSRTPAIVVQFLVHAGNVSSIGAMYRLGVSLGVEKVLFNDVAGEGWAIERGTPELDRAVAEFRAVMQEDGDRGAAVIHSHSLDLAPYLGGARRRPLQRIRDALRRGRPLAKLAAPLTKAARDALRESTDCCIAPWHSMTIRATGEVPVCCALQDRPIGQVRTGSLASVWHGAGFARIRQQIRRSIREGATWTYRPERDTEIVDFCAANCGKDRRCRFRSYYFAGDWPFLQQLRSQIVRARRGAR